MLLLKAICVHKRGILMSWNSETRGFHAAMACAHCGAYTVLQLAAQGEQCNSLRGGGQLVAQGATSRAQCNSRVRRWAARKAPYFHPMSAHGSYVAACTVHFFLLFSPLIEDFQFCSKILKVLIFMH